MKGSNLLFLVNILLFFACSGDISQNLDKSLSEVPTEAIMPLETIEDLDPLINEIGDSRIVLLGEASHGTSEFYTWRAEITKRLILEKNFKIIAIEGDWEDAFQLNQYIKGSGDYSSARAALFEFDRWPKWMWANEEVEQLGEWLRAYNSVKTGAEQVGFFGLDVYGIWESLDEVKKYLDATNPDAAAVAGEVMNCFAPYNRDEDAYIRATMNSNENCADELAKLLEKVKLVTAGREGEEAAFNALQNTLVAVNAEYYYRIAPISNSQSWNIRDRHMDMTIKRLLDRGGNDSKIIIWEHNSHIGDARATDMANAGMINVGQLVRENYGENEVYIVGFGTYKGKVIAAESWGSNPKTMTIPGAKRNSWEWILHNLEPKNKIVLMTPLKEREYYNNPIGHRAIGVVYNPGAESGNYVPSVLPKRYNAFIFIDSTTAVNSL